MSNDGLPKPLNSLAWSMRNLAQSIQDDNDSRNTLGGDSGGMVTAAEYAEQQVFKHFIEVRGLPVSVARGIARNLIVAMQGKS